MAESHFIAEFIPTQSDVTDFPDAQELVLTTLARRGSPVIRYRTGDLVVPAYPGDAPEVPNRFVHLKSGVLGRIDDMVVIRGVNIFPTSIEKILRSFADIGEYRILATRNGAMDELQIEVENQSSDQLEKIEQSPQSRLGLRVPVTSVAAGSLPRSEAKSRRFVDERQS